MSDTYQQLQELGDPVFEKIPNNPRLSFRWHTHSYPAPLAKWNFHPEYELHLIRRSRGHYVVGDYMGHFGPGNLVLIGPNLPHCWYSDLATDSQIIYQRDVVIQFRGEWLQSLMHVCPELESVQPMLDDCERGVLFTGTGAISAGQQMKLLGAMSGWERVSTFIGLLGTLSHNNYRLISSQDYRLRHTGAHSEQIDAVLRYLHGNFNEPIRMTEIAAWQGMSTSTFSRFFKQLTGDTFTRFIRRLRIDYACRLLHDADNSVAEICFMTGYSNISNFNRHFRLLVGMTPRQYRQSLQRQVGESLQGQTGYEPAVRVSLP